MLYAIHLTIIITSAWLAVDAGVQALHAKQAGRPAKSFGLYLLGIGANILITISLISYYAK